MNQLVHWEIPSTDLKKSRTFYQKLFGWKMKPLGKNYVLFDIDKGVGGGITKVKKVPKPCLGVYIGVDDIPRTLFKVLENGGKVKVPRTPIGKGMGYIGAFLDPCGCMIGLWSKN